MSYVLITVTGGIVDEVAFYGTQSTAIQALSTYVKTMDAEKNDAGVYGPNGMIVNAKTFLDKDDRYVEQNIREIVTANSEEPIYIIGNPNHVLGFMVASPDDPLGYKDPVAAISELGQMRQDHGMHLELYRLEPVSDPMTNRPALEQYNREQEVDGFEYSLVNEYLEEGK